MESGSDKINSILTSLKTRALSKDVKYIIVLISCPNQEVSEQIANVLLEGKLVA